MFVKGRDCILMKLQIIPVINKIFMTGFAPFPLL